MTEEEFDEQYLAGRDELMRRAMKYCMGRTDDAEDACSSVYLQCRGKCATIRPSSFISYLVAALYNSMGDAKKRSYYQSEKIGAYINGIKGRHDTIDNPVDEALANYELEKFETRLNDRELMIFNLRAKRGMTIREIAERTGLSAPAINYTLERIKSKIRKSGVNVG